MSDDFDALLDAAVERKTVKPDTAIAEVLVNDTAVTLKFTEMDALKWAGVTAVNPVRLGSPIDHQYGFDTAGAAKMAAVFSGVRVVGDSEHELSFEQWEKIFTAISGGDLAKIADAVFMVNVYNAQIRLVSAKKASAVAPAKKRRSPAS